MAGVRAWRAQLARELARPAVLVGIGQRLCGDDGIGPEIAVRLHGRSVFECVDAGPAPENFLGAIARRRPAMILLVDAVHFHAPAGTVRLFSAEELAETDASTHGLSPGLLLRLMSERTGAPARLLGIQPHSCELGEGLSPACRRAATRVCRALAESRLQPARTQTEVCTPDTNDAAHSIHAVAQWSGASASSFCAAARVHARWRETKSRRAAARPPSASPPSHSLRHK